MIRFRNEGDLSDTGFCDRNLNLLAHAQAIELEIGSRCGGHGVCGGDRVRIVTTNGSATETTPMLSPLTAAERQHLSPDEIARGFRLACQCFPDKNDQRITLEFTRSALAFTPEL
jgi:ferredoxin